MAPSALVQLARKHRLNAVALTDHDTTGGIAEAQEAAQGSPFIIPAVELSAHLDGQDIDILGYYIQPDDLSFQAALAQIAADRLTRGQRMVECLNALGVPLAWERVLALSAGGVVNRAHIARALVESGQVSSVPEAVERYLLPGGAAYVPRHTMTPAAAIASIHAAGGAAVLAHPGVYGAYAALVERFVADGLDGVEVLHPANGETVRANLRGLARGHNLVITGGSDFHTPRDRLGAFNPPPECLRDLRERAGRYR